MNLALRGLGAFDPFGTIAKQRRKERVELQTQAGQQQLAVAQFEKEKAALDAFRQKIRAKLEEVEAVALSAAKASEGMRALARDPRLEGDPLLDEVDQNLADLETGLVQIQTGTVVELATLDANKLAISYSDAQASLVAMTSLKNRVLGLVSDMQRRLEGIRLEQTRAESLQQKSAALAQRERSLQVDLEAQERRRQQAALADEALRQRQAEWAQQQREEERRRAALADQVRELDEQIDLERRGLERARSALSRLRMAAQ